MFLKYKHSKKEYILYEKIVLVMLCTGANFAKKNSCLVARIVLYYTAGLHLLTFHILEPYPFKDIALGRLSLKRGFNGCGHRLGGCDGLGGFD